MVWADWVVRGFALFGVIVFSWQVGKYGIRYVMTEIAGWFSVTKTEFQNLHGYVLVLENRLIALEQHHAVSIPPINPAAEPPKAA
jgi:hypothetical protein